MDVRTVSVVAVVVGTAVYALYEYLFKNDAHRQQQYRRNPSPPEYYDTFDEPQIIRRRPPPRSRKTNERNDRESTKRSEDSCSICLTSLLKGVVIGTACNHQFHYQCLVLWLKEQKICPICRSHVSLNE